MIDARVDGAVKQHLQKMDWLRGEEEAQSLTPPPARATTTVGKRGFNLPLGNAPQTENMITPVLEMYAKQESEGAPACPETRQSAEGESPAGRDSRDAAGGEAASSEGENKESASSPPKDGTPVWDSKDWCKVRLTRISVSACWTVYDNRESSWR